MTSKNINLIKGDITTLKVDAIVNAANTRLLGGGGVDGAIHEAAGPQLLEECRVIGGCPTGEARITKGYNLKSKYIIHTVGPIWRGGSNDEAMLLKSAYRNSLQLAQKQKVKSIAFPNISTGIYGFPKLKAAKIAIESVKKFLHETGNKMTITFVCFDEENYYIYKGILDGTIE
jgi:O-acetyl-ADP-ribose deacetylase (regulator of RNase III)